jgi:hypothetical protein
MHKRAVDLNNGRAAQMGLSLASWSTRMWVTLTKLSLHTSVNLGIIDFEAYNAP